MHDSQSLHEAAWKGSLSEVNKCLGQGVDVNAKDKRGSTPLHNAALFGHHKVADYLLDAGAEVNAKDKRGRTPLCRGATRLKIASLLLERGAVLDDASRGLLESKISNPAKLHKGELKNIRKHLSIYHTAKSIRSLMYGVLTTGLLSALYCFRNNINWLANIAGKYLLSLPILTGSISIMFVAMNAYKASGFKTEDLAVSEMIQKGCGLFVGTKPRFS